MSQGRRNALLSGNRDILYPLGIGPLILWKSENPLETGHGKQDTLTSCWVLKLNLGRL